MQRNHPHRSRNILFVGMPGVGKTTLGRVYAYRTGREFIDFDFMLEKHCGKTIREIFATEGEAGFRAREQRMLHRLGHKRGAVIAMGGGTLCNPVNMRFARTLGVLVQLKASVETIAQRVFAEKQKRPMFSQMESEEAARAKVAELYSMRSEFYDCSDIEINTDYSSIDCLVLELMQIERRAHSILQNRSIPKILMSDLGKPPVVVQPPEPAPVTPQLSLEPKKPVEISLVPASEEQFAAQDFGPRQPWETCEDLVWKESIFENLQPKREKKDPAQRLTPETQGAGKKKRRKKKRKPGGGEMQGAQAQDESRVQPQQQPAQPTLLPRPQNRPQRQLHDRPQHRSGNRSQNSS